MNSFQKNIQRCLASAAIVFACLSSLSETLAETKSAGSLPSADQEFLLKAAQGGMTEVALGKLAAEKGSTDQIRDFGKMMVKDHEKINSEVGAVAKKKGVTLPASLDEKHQAKVDKLSKLGGTDFDAAYLSAMGTMHAKDLAAFTAEKESTQDGDLKAVLTKAIPIIESHIEHLKSITTPAKS